MKRLVKALLSLICFLLLSSLFPHNADAISSLVLAQVNVDPDYEIEVQQNTVCSFITGNNVNIRSGPSTKSSVIAQLNRGDGVRAQYRKGDWVKLAARVYGTVPNERFKPLNGWVFNQYINGCSEDQFDRWRVSEAPSSGPLLAVDSEGLRLVNPDTGSTRPISFGTVENNVIGVLTSLRGEPSDRGLNSDCGAGPLKFATWPDGLRLWFKQDRFIGWEIDGRKSGANKITTINGIGIGISRSKLGSATVSQTSLGTEFSMGNLFGLLSGNQSNAKVTLLWSGTTCLFR